MDLISKKSTEILLICKENKIPAVITVFYKFKKDGTKYFHEFMRPEEYGYTLKNNYISDYINEISSNKTIESVDAKNTDFKVEENIVKKLCSLVIELSLLCKQYSAAMAFGCCTESCGGEYKYLAQVVSLKMFRKYIRNDKISSFIRHMCGYEQEKKENSNEENNALEKMQREFSDFQDVQSMFKSEI